MAKEIMDAFNTYKNGADLQFMVDECLNRGKMVGKE
jgi:hypothetical protein